MSGMTLEDFLGHKTRERSDFAKATYLSGWRKRENAVRNKAGDLENSVTVWLSTKALFQARWAHSWPKIMDLKKTNSRAVWMQDFVCLEPESVLRNQYKRERDTGKRVVPPTTCPHCLLLEQVRDHVREGRLNWTDVLFKYEAGDDVKELRAGGIYGAFSSQKLTDAEKAQMAAARIYQKDAWKENANAKCNYICRVVDNDHPEKGIQISIELDSIGDAMKRKLAEEIEGRGEAGNPMLHPYPLRWKFYPDETDFRKKFAVVAMTAIKPTDEILRLITEEEPPSIDHLTTPGNMRALRASMEEACLHNEVMDWDAIFGPVEAFCDADGRYQAPGTTHDTDPPPADDGDDLPF